MMRRVQETRRGRWSEQVRSGIRRYAATEEARAHDRPPRLFDTARAC